MNNKQRLIVTLLVIAILLSLTSIALSISIGISPVGFKFINKGSDDSNANVGVIINSPSEIENGNE